MLRLNSILLFVGLAGALTSCSTLDEGADRSETVDLIIVGGEVYDGISEQSLDTQIAIDDGRMVAIGRDLSYRLKAARTIEAAGLIVAPGFIDPHTHADGDLLSNDAERRANLPFAFQGVTTVVIGNDGFGDHDIAAQVKAMRETGIGTNVAMLAGFGSIRDAVIGKADRAPSEHELGAMRELVRKAMCEGAWGFSTGLYYVPQNYASTEEVVELAREAGAFGGYYDTHMRDESTYNITVEGALAETLDIGRKAGLPVHIAHIKALGPSVWGHSAKMIAMTEAAQATGQRVTADQYPWEASGTRISNALVPRWAMEGGLEALRQRLSDPDQAPRIRQGIAEGFDRRGGADRLLVTGPLHGAEVETGKTLEEIADAQGVSPVDAAIDILRRGDARLASFNMNPTDIAAFAMRDWVVTGSDGSTGHPRKYGSFPKAYRDLVRDNGAMSLGRFIRRSSSQTAEIIGLKDRGVIALGMAGDIVIFDPDEFAPKATYSSPRERAAGVRYLLINGEIVIESGDFTGRLPGQPLLKQTAC